MAPKFKFTKEEIKEAAVALVRESGPSALTARALADRLGSSAKPIFGLFTGMTEVMSCVMEYAAALYEKYISEAMTGDEYPPYKASGMAYIRFAKEEREFFKLLFMRDRSGEEKHEDREAIRPILDVIMKNLSLGEDEAYLFHMEMWIFVHGIATMTAGAYLEWDMDFVSSALTDMYQGLIARFKTKASENLEQKE